MSVPDRRAPRPSAYSRSRMCATATTLTRASSPWSASASACTAGSDSSESLARNVGDPSGQAVPARHQVGQKIKFELTVQFGEVQGRRSRSPRRWPT